MQPKPALYSKTAPARISAFRGGSFFILDDFLKCLLQRRFDSLRRIDRCDHQLVRIYRSEIQIIPRIFCQL